VLLKNDYINEIKVSNLIRYGSSAKRGVDFLSGWALSWGRPMSRFARDARSRVSGQQDVGYEGVITGRDALSLRSSIADPQGVAQHPLQSTTSHSVCFLACHFNIQYEQSLPIYHKIVSGYFALISISCNAFFVVIATSMSCDFNATYSSSSNIKRRANAAK